MGPYDSMVRYMWQRSERVAAQLRAVLPATLVDQIDFATLQPWSPSSVDEQLTRREGDALFSVSLGGREALLYVLLEHQSTEDPFMALRILEYLTRIWRRWRQEHPQATRLPVIVPVVLFQGPDGWTAPTRFEDLLEVEESWWESVAPFVPRFEFVLDDLAAVSEGELRARSGDDFYRLVTVVLRRIQLGEEALFEVLLGNADLFVGIESRLDLEALFQLIFKVSELGPDEVLKRLRDRLTELAKEATVTGAERLIAQGRAEGEAKGKAEVLLRQLRAKFAASIRPEVEARVRAATSEELDVWCERVLLADDLAGVFEQD